jgi:hypothetical protein
MAKKNSDLSDRLRRAGLRKQVAKMLSEIGDDASKKAHKTARTAVSELRALADEIERRLPSATPERRPSRRTAGAASTKGRATNPRATKSRAASSTRAAAPTRPAATKAKPASRRAPAGRASTTRRTSATPRPPAEK